jgi:hypothetical protein
MSLTIFFFFLKKKNLLPKNRSTGGAGGQVRAMSSIKKTEGMKEET